MDNNIFDSLYQTFIVKKAYKILLDGLYTTLLVTFCAFIIGLILGLLITFIRMKHHFNGSFRIMNKIVVFFVYIIRGTPVFVQLLIYKFIIFKNLFGSFITAILCFGFNSAAYISEISKSGTLGVDIGQYKAGLSLGFTDAQTFRLIVFPQALEKSLPSLINEFSALLKETAILSEIGVIDLTGAAKRMVGATYDTASSYLATAVIYLIVVSIVSFMLNLLQKKLLVKYSGG